MNIAIFGGTFDPIHSAHLGVAREAADRFHLDRVLFIPAGNPPHKRTPLAAYEHRFRMAELACAGDPRFLVSRLEEGDKQSYSYDTIQAVKKGLAPGDRLFFLIGADAFAEIHTWRKADEVLKEVEFIVVTRPGHEYVTPPGSRVHRLDAVALPISSSEIRQKLAQGRRAPELPEAVEAYVREHGLYL